MEVQIESIHDCKMCERRNRNNWELLLAVVVQCLGAAWCNECGRRYEVLAEATAAGGDDG